MKILHLTPSFPYPPDTGGRICIWNQLRADALFGEVGLLTFLEEQPAAGALEAVRAICTRVVTIPRPRSLDGIAGGLRSLVSPVAMNLAKYRWPVYARALRRMMADFRPDVVVANNLHMGGYLLDLEGTAVILREQNIDSDLMERYAATVRNPGVAAFARLQVGKVRDAETRIAPRVDHCLMITPLDEARLHAIAPRARTSVIPGVIAPEEYRAARPPAPGDDLLVVATGTFTFLPTGEGLLHFVDHVWPRVLNAAPRARFRVIGHCPDALRRKVESVQGIEILGRVPAVEAHLDGAHVFVVPLRAGSGMRMRILEAMAWQVPIVTTALGCEGIAVESSRHVLIHNDPAGMASDIVRLGGDEDLARGLRREGRRFVEEHFSLLAAGRSADRIYRDCLQSPAVPGEPAPVRRAP